MPVIRYRDVDEMPPAPLAETPAAGIVAACAQSRIAAELGRTAALPRGVRRFRSVEAADADRREREITAMRSVVAQRRT